MLKTLLIGALGGACWLIGKPRTRRGSCSNSGRTPT